MADILTQVRMILWMVLHHRWAALAVTASLAVVGGIGVLAIPSQYEADARVYLDTESVLNPLLEGLAVDNSVREKSAVVVRRTLLTRPNLIEVMRATDLDLQAQTEVETQAMVSFLARRIEVLGHADKRLEDANIYTITYRDKDPVMAKNVVDALLNVFLDQVLGISRLDTSKAQTFLDSQIAEYKQRLEVIENTLTEFKRQHADVSPGQDIGYYQRLEQSRSVLAEATLKLKEARRRLSDLDEQIAKVGRTLSDFAEDADTELTKSPLDVRAETMQLRLDELLLVYTDDHPDVTATRNALAQIKQEIAAARAAGGDSAVQAKQLRENPVVQELTVVRGQAQAEVAALQARAAEYRSRVTELEGAVESLPAIEAQYTKLTRDYEVTRETYDSLVTRRESAGISQSAEETGDQVQFRVVEPATVPLIPVWPNRPLILTGALLVALAAGVGMAWFLAQIQPTYYTREQLVDTFSLPVLGTVTMIWSGEQIAKRRWGVLVYSVGGLILFAGYAVAMLFSLGESGALSWFK